jgi:TRAP-type C4-dicarboxylate transport system permease small subunit
MKKTKTLIGRILKLGTLFSTFGFVGATLIQIDARFFMESAPAWTEEAARFFFVYAMSFAAGLAMKSKYYVHLDVLFNKLKEKQQKMLEISISLCVLLLFLILAIYSIQFILLGIPEKSPSLGISMSLAFGSMFIMGLSICLYALFDLQKNFKKLS